MKRAFAPLLLLTLLLTSCGSQAGPEPVSATEPVTGTVFAMDTVMDFTIYGEETLLAAAESRIHELEAKLSVTEESSEIYAINHNGSGHVSADTADLLDQALALCGQTGGALDLSIYPVVRAWGFTTGDYGVPETEELAELLAHVDYTKIDFDRKQSAVTLPPRYGD